MDYDDFFREATEKKIILSIEQFNDSINHRLSNEALFHLPLLAMTILLLSKTKRKPKLDELGQLIGECFERTFSGFKGSSQRLGWSANLRMRTVRALTFLETAHLVELDYHDNRIKATDFGKIVISKAINAQSDLSYVLQVIEHNYFDLQIEKKIAMDL